MWRPRRSISQSSGLPVFPGLASRRRLALFLISTRVPSVAQSLFDWKSINACARRRAKLEVGGIHLQRRARSRGACRGFTYLQAIADEARIETAEAQVKTAQALYDQATDQVKAGTSADIDGLRAKVELQTRQQQLIQAQNNFAIQKLTVARVIGLAPGQEFEFTDKSPYQAFEGITH